MDEPSKPVSKLRLLDYMNLALGKNYMLWILVTSGAEGLEKSLGFDYGAGKSTEGLWLLCDAVYAGNWDKTKRATIGTYWEMRRIIDEMYAGCYFDEIELTLGKHQQHNPEIRELAYYMKTVRPYTHIWIASAPHRDTIQKDFREMFHFEIIISERGIYEVQQLKRRIDFDNPQQIDERLRYRGSGLFPPLPTSGSYGNIQAWYDEWRHNTNLEIRNRVAAFKRATIADLDITKLSEPERVVLGMIREKVFIRYETLLQKGYGSYALRLKRRGWLEIDRGRRYQLSAGAEDVLLSNEVPAAPT